MPGASRARGLVCGWKKHTASHHRSAAFAGIPCAMVFDLFRAHPGETELCCHGRGWKHLPPLGTSIGVPGPHVYIFWHSVNHAKTKKILW